jgi:hypothetical protein
MLADAARGPPIAGDDDPRDLGPVVYAGVDRGSCVVRRRCAGAADDRHGQRSSHQDNGGSAGAQTRETSGDGHRFPFDPKALLRAEYGERGRTDED